MWGTTGENGKTSGIGQPSLPPSSFVCLRAGGALLCLIDIAAQPVQASIGRQAPFFHQFESVTAPLFLQERDDGRALAGPYPPAFSPETLFIGSGAMGVEVAHFTCERRPSPAELRSLHEIRQQRRPTPVLVAVTHPPRMRASSRDSARSGPSIRGSPATRSSGCVARSWRRRTVTPAGKADPRFPGGVARGLQAGWTRRHDPARLPPDSSAEPRAGGRAAVGRDEAGGPQDGEHLPALRNRLPARSR
jgi:hypothetical protein